MRALGVALILYGVIGLILVGGGWMVGAGALTRVAQLSENAEASITAAATTVQNAAQSFDGFEASLVEANAAAQNAAAVARDTSVTMTSLAGAMAISILGTQPWLPLARDFERGAEQLAVLSADLDRLGLALSANIEDVSAIGADLDLLGQRLDRLTAPGPGAPETRALAAGSGPLQLVLYGVLAWLALQAVAALMAGMLLLLRPWRRRETVVVER